MTTIKDFPNGKTGEREEIMMICSKCRETRPDLPLPQNWRKNGMIRKAGRKVVQRWQCMHCGSTTTKSPLDTVPVTQNPKIPHTP